MALRDRLRRLTRQAEEDSVLIRQRSGAVRAFDVMDVEKDMFLAQYELFKGEAYASEILEAVRNATPASRHAFEERFGEIHMVARIIAPEKDGGWVEVFTLLEDGAVERVLHKGDSVEAKRIREEARAVGTRRRLERLEERLVAQTASPDGEAWGELLKRLTTDDAKLCTRMSSVSLYFFLGTYLCTCF